MTIQEYTNAFAEKTARNKGFRNRREYDSPGKRAKVFHITKAQYYETLERDSCGFYILPEISTGSQENHRYEEN